MGPRTLAKANFMAARGGFSQVEASRDFLHSDSEIQNPEEKYFVLYTMPSSWSYLGLSKGNKENVVVAGMANLSITDNEGSKKLTGGSNEPNGE
jgi:hypothetical protein